MGTNAIPDDTDDELETVEVRIRLIALDDVLSLATLPTDAIADVPGGASLQSAVYTFTLVSVLDDAAAPAVTIATKDKKLNDDGNVVFTIKFTEAVTGFSLSDIDVIGGTKEDFVTGESDTYTLTVKPASADTKVTVKIAAGAVMDSAENGNEAGKGSYTPDGYVAKVTITAADGTGDDEGKVIFTLNFSEAPNAFSIASLSVTGAAAPGVTDLVKLVGDEADEDSCSNLHTHGYTDCWCDRSKGVHRSGCSQRHGEQRRG